MYARVAEYMQDARPSLRIDVSDHVYSRYLEQKRAVRQGRFERVI